MPRKLLISLKRARKATNRLVRNFRASLRSATDQTLFSLPLLCGISSQETAYFWHALVNRKRGALTPDEIIACCVPDVSGDPRNVRRGVFPRNSAAYHAKSERSFGDMLMEEANATDVSRPPEIIAVT
jgi:hypothetical protein